jgi:signal transduction histidine kinase
MTLDLDELIEVNRLRVVSRVVSNAVHDVNNALQVIGGSAEMLGGHTTIGPVEHRRVQAIASQAERIAATLDRLSAITRPDTGGRQIVELTRVTDDAVALRAFSLGRARIAVNVERPVGVSCVVSAERRRILQLFLNLLLNVEQVLANKPGASLNIRFERSDREWGIVFADNGPGLDPAARAHLARGAPCPTLGRELSGVGLWLSARIAEQHGGCLEAMDVPAGSSIRVRLPAGS